MKVVLFCGGLGTRIRDFSDAIPKPMIAVGYRPIIWNVMKYYAHFGHKEFILCLGYKADQIKNYFLHYDECVSNDFVYSDGGKKLVLANSDIQDWRITFVDTGLNSNIGQRLKAVEKFLGDDEMFLANYTDGLSDFPLPTLTDEFVRTNKIGAFLAVKPSYSFHVVAMDEQGQVQGLRDLTRSDIWINAGYFVFRREIFKYLQPGEDLVNEPFQRLADTNALMAHKYRGFWACMDTFKEKQRLDDMVARGETPWEVWKRPAEVCAASSSLVLGAAMQGLRPISVQQPESVPTEATASHAAA
jgi:glucose-1-phosphate cytidylyltransferase